MSFNQQDRVSWLWLFIFLSYSTGITEDDPRWLGAWWIGFLLAWLFAWSLIIPFSCFPKHLPGKYIFFKARELYFNSRTNIAFSMIDKKPRKLLFYRILLVCLCKLLNICLYFRKYCRNLNIYVFSFIFD